MKLKLRLDDIVSLCYVLFAIWTLNPYFTWSSYLGGVFGYINGNIPIRSIFALLSCIMAILYIGKTHKKGKLSRMSLFIVIDAVILLGVCGGNLFDTAWISYIAIALFLMIPVCLQKRTFEMFMSIFVITLIPSLIFYLLDFVDIHLPYSVLNSYEAIKVNSGIYYKHRLFSAQLINPMSSINRFNGIYFEAGILGTLAAMLLGVKEYSIVGKGKWREKILFIAGICSFSLAFIMLSLIYYIVKNVAVHKLKNIAIVAGIIVAYIVFTTIPLSSPALSNIQRRMTIVDYTLQGDNRTSKGYERIMEKFYTSSPEKKIFGYGRDAFEKIQTERNADGSSYKSILYDYGYLGILTYGAWFIIYAREARKKLKLPMPSLMTVVLMQFANIYQNPAVFPIYFVLIFSGGIAVISKEV